MGKRNEFSPATRPPRPPPRSPAWSRARAPRRRQIENYTRSRSTTLIRAMVWSVARPGVAEEIAQLTVEETQLGNYEGKYLKIFRKTRAALMDIIDDKSVGVHRGISRARDRRHRQAGRRDRRALALDQPRGDAGDQGDQRGQGAQLDHHRPPSARQADQQAGLRPDARRRWSAMGAPADLVIAIETPTLDKTNELMKQCDRILATGGGPMVKAAYSSGTPALGVGVGNAVITVDETADLDDAAEKIRISKTLDFAASCSSDNSVLLVDAIYDEMLGQAEGEGRPRPRRRAEGEAPGGAVGRRRAQRQDRRPAARDDRRAWPASTFPKAPNSSSSPKPAPARIIPSRARS